ncbi:MAG: AAA family ATPase [Clostridiales bacterium]|nr:AAA family ATPase [Clostridiales bacterium]
MQNKLIEIEFDGAWVLQKSKKQILPVETFVQELIQDIGSEDAVKVLKKNYVSCQLLVALEEESQDLNEKVERILRNELLIEEGDDICIYSTQALSEEEVNHLLNADKPEEAKEEQMVDQDSSDASTHPSAPSAYDRIQELVGAEEFKQMAAEFVSVAPQIRELQAERAFLFQNYLFSINDGCGFSTALNLMADLLEELELFRFQGKRKVTELVMELPSNDEDMSPIARVCDYVDSRSNYYGILSIDISQWIQKLEDHRFKKLLKQIRSMEEHFLFVFRVPFIENAVLNKVLNSLNHILYTRKISFAPFSNEELTVCAARQVEKCHFQMAEEAWPVFNTRLTEEKNDGRFYGINTIEKMVDEMIYLKLLNNSRTGVSDTVIHREDIQDFNPRQELGNKTGLEMLDEMIGIAPIQERLLEMVAQIEMQKELSQKNPSLERPCLHMRFVGHPGTGKTTVARLLGKIFKEKGILSVGNFYEVSGRDLCGRYVGETAPKTSEICRNAYGSVLFIDEAYSLYNGDDNSRDYGKEAITTLISEMESHRDDMVVIMSGYPDEMKTLMGANPGLAGRMPYELEFSNYSKEELIKIFLQMAGRDFRFDNGFTEAARQFFESISAEQYRDKAFSNARLARNLYERVWSKAAIRHSLHKEDEILLTAEDVGKAVLDKEFTELLKKKKKSIGFGKDDE